MEIKNIFKIHTWEIKKFLEVILAIQLAVIGIMGLDLIGLSIPILRPLLGFFYLTFVPGILILRLLKMYDLDTVESLLYAVGLSITILMFTGFLMNLLYPVLGITKPITFFPILISISTIVVVLSVLCYLRDDGVSEKPYLKVENINLTTFLLLIPFLVIIGTYLVNFYNNNVLIFVILLIIPLIVIMGLSNRFNTNLYPLTIFVISISLLFHNSLISMNLWGFDINLEFYLANLVVKNASWMTNVTADANSMLSVVVLAPIYSLICNLSLDWVFKIIYPFIFSLVPLGIYVVVKKYTSAKIAFLSVFYFMAVYMFYCDMLQLARQEIAELFFILLILLIIRGSMDQIKRSILFIMFGFSLIVSHYGLSYIYMFFVISTVIIVYLISIGSFEKFRSLNLKNKLNYNFNELTLTFNFALLIVIVGIAWYMYIAGSSPFISFVKIFSHMFGNIFNIFDPTYSQGMAIVTSRESLPFHQLTKYLFLFSQFLIAIGISSILSKKTNFSMEYRILSFLSFSLLLLGLALPFLSASLQTSRFYQIMLLILSPFFVLGALNLFSLTSKITKFKIDRNAALYFVAIFLMIFFLFNSGVVYKVTNEIEPSVALISLDNSFDYLVFNDEEKMGAIWLVNFKKNGTIYADRYRSLLLAGFIKSDERKDIRESNIDKIHNSLIYLGSFNIKESRIAVKSFLNSSFGEVDYIDAQKFWDNDNVIYENGGSRIIYST